MLNLEDLDDIESKLTSASSKKQKLVAGSLSTVLGQALTSDDTETLDWILQQKDQQMISNTLVNLKDVKHVNALFKQVVVKFQ